MEKFGKVLLFILNVFINIFLISIVLLLLLWLIWDITPAQSVQNTLLWVENSWDKMTGRSPRERLEGLSKKQREKAHRHIYVQDPPGKDGEKGRITQPYKYE